MRVLERGQDAVHQLDGLGRRHGAAGDEVLEEGALDALHDDERHLHLDAARLAHRLFAGIEDAHDRRVRHPGRGLGLLPEPGAERRVVGEGGLQQLDRDLPAEAGIRAGIHVGHAAVTEQRPQPVASGDDADVGSHLLIGHAFLLDVRISVMGRSSASVASRQPIGMLSGLDTADCRPADPQLAW
ncbi:hypothetical protein GCM10025881_19640 [Pseudolysinimonas kribbensis]|uniref:Uncharacterized protein n=1 Tax=Pseudolysinimonas kribbensis TaxID=433641 RepID=A0ABQ6K839_9MICO|nr:hypothetical protein GCM10025881_19640 [Pseudolysinimonas kribbensis]